MRRFWSEQEAQDVIFHDSATHEIIRITDYFMIMNFYLAISLLKRGGESSFMMTMKVGKISSEIFKNQEKLKYRFCRK